ncbi:MAG: glycosyltransferase [Verrucomicrobiae bacterium]|nr:glycosyltransferase [Verrucomicrobiae bacterium]
MRILHAVETLDRNGGGLPVAVTGLANALAHLNGGNFENDLFSPRTANPVSVDDAVAIHRTKNVRGVFEISAFNLVHQHGIWAKLPVTAGRLAKRSGLPFVLSPHGMLEPWALDHHAWRKRVALALYQRRNLESADVLHATSPAETAQLRELGLRQPIAEIPLGIEPIPPEPLDPEAVAAPKSKREVLFLSRIHPKKGIDLLLQAWAGIDAPDWKLIIAGPDNGGYQTALGTLTRNLGLDTNRVHFAGPLFGSEKDTALRRADLFVLPSHSENFGFVVPEAMQYGLPVITTTGTPWDVLTRECCGWRVAPSVDEIKSALAEAIALGDDERTAMGERGCSVIDREYRWPAIAARFAAVYDWLMEGGAPSPPNSITLE